MKTREEILQMVENEDVEFIRLQFTDMFFASFIRKSRCSLRISSTSWLVAYRGSGKKEKIWKIIRSRL